MIANKRQYRITKAQLDRFEQALAEMATGRSRPADVSLSLAQAEIDGMWSQAEELRQQIAEYEELAAGRTQVLELDSFDQFPIALIKARISAGLSQKELAEKLGLKEQQIQRYEASAYASASVSRIQQVMDALGVKVRKHVFLPSARKGLKYVLSRLARMGIDKRLVLDRLVSPAQSAAFVNGSDEADDDWSGLAVDVAANVSRVFRWNPSKLLQGEALTVGGEAVGAARFKLRSKTEQSRLSAYTVYAHYLAMLLLQATPELQQEYVPTDPREFRRRVLDRCGAVSLRYVLALVWDMGIPVLPLQDPGAFQGACWRVDGRNVIALKQKNASQSRWLHDLLHELWHAGETPDEPDLACVTVDESQTEAEDIEEQANGFAGNILLDGRAEALAEMCVQEARGRIQYLKTAVQRVAGREGFPVGALANYMAFRLSLQGENWWGTARNLQEDGEEPFSVTRDILLQRVDLNRLNAVDAGLLMRALTDGKE